MPWHKVNDYVRPRPRVFDWHEMCRSVSPSEDRKITGTGVDSFRIKTGETQKRRSVGGSGSWAGLRCGLRGTG